MPAPEILDALRIVADPSALDRVSWPGGTVPLRIAPDEVLAVGADSATVADRHAIVVREHGFCGLEMERATFDDWFSREAAWPHPGDGFAQGDVAGLPVKVWIDAQRALVVTRASLRAELEARA